jgi:hypothetical protein
VRVTKFGAGQPVPVRRWLLVLSGKDPVLGLSQDPDEHSSESPVFLAVGYQLGEGAALRVAPELADPFGPLEVGRIRTWRSSACGGRPRVPGGPSGGVRAGQFSSGIGLRGLLGDGVDSRSRMSRRTIAEMLARGSVDRWGKPRNGLPQRGFLGPDSAEEGGVQPRS